MAEAELKKIRKIRGGHRGYVRKLVSELEPQLENFEPSMKDKLTQQRLILKEKLQLLKELDDKVLDQEENVEMIEGEINESSEFNDQITWVLVRIESNLESLKINHGKEELNSSNSTVDQTPKAVASTKLPKLIIKKFNGVQTEWQTFIDCFDNSVHVNENLSDVDKMNYLKSLLEGPALAAINGLSLTSANYAVAREILQQRYGNKQLNISSHMENLLKLQTVSSVNDIKGIRQLYDKTEIHIRGLQTLGVGSQQYGSLLIPVLLSKLPQELRLIISRKFEDQDWDLDELLKTFKTEVEARERCNLMSATSSSISTERKSHSKPPITAATLLAPKSHKITCTYCRGDHKSVNCEVVGDVQKRMDIVKSQGRCFICLKRTHLSRNCDSRKNCFKCNSQRHHPSLCRENNCHRETNQPIARGNQQQEPSNWPGGVAQPSQGNKVQVTMPTNTDGQSKPTFGLYVEGKTSVLLQTCIAEASNPSPGEIQSQRVRLILDTGSQKTYITEQLKEALDLKPIGRETLCIKTFGSECNKIQTVDVVKLCLKGVDNDQHMYINAHVVPMICSPLSYQAVQYAREQYPHLSDLTLSDECYDENLEVHVLIGSDNYWNIVNGQTRRGAGGPVAVNTKFGWTVSGPVHYVSSCDSDSVNLAATHVLRAETQVCDSIEDQELDQRLETFWQLESIGINPDENPVLETFNKSITFKRNGMYEVKLPWKEVHDPLPDNYSLSLTRLNSLLQRLKTKPERLKEYDRVIKEQLTRGMIERVKQNDTVSSKIHYLPHHCVVREDKQTTKLHIVYNASAKEDGPSLNECLYSGPSLTPDILDILIRFRLRPIALVADIEKAFLMISVEENDRDVLRFLWVDDPFSSNPKVIPYRFTRVVFGVTSSPFLLNATLHKHINEYLLEDPPFVKEMLRSLYVDDVTTSLKDVEMAYQFYNKARQRLAQGGFNLRKWLSNSPELMQRIKASETREQEGATETTQQLSEDDETYNRVKVGGLEERDANTEQKILGINWNFTSDQIHFKFQAHVEKAKGLRPTKRNILKVIAGFYDPMGILSPIIVQMKMLLQEICKAKYSWDAELNDSLKVKWMKLLSELEEVQSIQVPRSVTMQTDEDQVVYELHGFCDASTSAYAAVVYMLSKSTYEVQAQLIASKTRIAPLKTLTIPRLELLGALILSRLISRIKNTLSQEISVSKVCCWTDSMNVLYWIQGRDKEWKQFVNSRVAEIRKLTSAEMWNHVPGVENPADLASRGVDPSLLVNNPLWWHGPSWLTSKDDGQQQCTGLETYEPTTECLKEMKVKAQRELEESSALLAASTVKVRLSNLIRCEDYGNIFKLYKVTAYVIRFVRNLKAKTRKLNISELKTGTLSPEELNASELLWLKEAQSSMEASEKFNQQCIQLGVTSDENGLLRCKGRLANSPLQMDSKFPILLPNGHHITRLIIQDSHTKVMHNGVRETLNELRSRFWLIRGRQTIRAMIHGCQICRRYEGRAYKTEPLSDVPEFRFKEGHPFAATGVDFAGPLFVKSVGGKDSQNMKVYICLFTCGTTRATHLELVPNLSTPAFIRCLRRFIGRRGTPELLISDNAKTFKAAANQIRNIFKDPVTTDFLARRNIQWRFNLEKAPWWGGFFERMVKCTKRCLKKVLGKARLTYEELMTILVEVECILNSRPLTYMYPEDLEEALTPSHLLTGQRTLSLPDLPTQNPDRDPVSTRETVTRRARYLARLMDQFWKRWRREYVPALRESHRIKLDPHGQPIRLGDIVSIHDESHPRTLWKTGVVQELIRGGDQKVRGAQVRTVTNGKISYLRRPLQRLFPLELSEDVSKENKKTVPLKQDNKTEAVSKEEQKFNSRPRRQAAVIGEAKRRQNFH